MESYAQIIKHQVITNELFIFNSLSNLMITFKSLLITTKWKGVSVMKLNWSLILALLLINYMTLISFLILLHFIFLSCQMTIIYYTIYLPRKCKDKKEVIN